MDTSASMLAKNYEVSCLNEPGTEAAANWAVKCEAQEAGSPVTVSTIFQLFNEKTRALLYASKLNFFNENNCGGRCPIMGQLEVSGVGHHSRNTQWKVHSGIFFDHAAFEDAGVAEKWVYDDKEVVDAPTDEEL